MVIPVICIPNPMHNSALFFKKLGEDYWTCGIGTNNATVNMYYNCSFNFFGGGPPKL